MDAQAQSQNADLILSKLKLTLFSGLMSMEQLEEFAQFFTVKQMAANTIIKKKGQTIEEFCIIGEGTVRMEVPDASRRVTASTGSPSQAKFTRSISFATRQQCATVTGSGSVSNTARRGGSVPGSPGASSPDRRLLCIKKPGEYFGESMLAINTDSTSSGGARPTYDLNAISEGPVTLLVLTQRNYKSYLEHYPGMSGIVGSVAESMEQQLQSLDWFKDVSMVQLKMLVTMFRFVPLMDGSILFRENDFDRENGNALYFLYKGRLKVMVTEQKTNDKEEEMKEEEKGKQRAEEEHIESEVASSAASQDRFSSNSTQSSSSSSIPNQKVLTILNRGKLVGEVACMLDIPRTATIQAAESSLLLECSQKDFRQFITIVPDILSKFNSLLLDYNIHLRYFLHNPIVVEYFIQHCKSEYSCENMDFWLACREFDRLAESVGVGQVQGQGQYGVTQDQLESKAREIRTTFIGATAERQVNLRHAVETKLIQALDQKPIKKTVFLAAEEEILALMSSDSFVRFKRSELFKTCIETVNAPYTAMLRKLYLL